MALNKNNKVRKGLLLRLNLALLTNNEILRENCNNTLFNVSSQIRNKIIETLGQKINSMKKEMKKLFNNIKAHNHHEIETINSNIYNIKNSIKRKTMQIQNCKHKRDDISNKTSKGNRKKNRRFNRNFSI